MDNSPHQSPVQSPSQSMNASSTLSVNGLAAPRIKINENRTPSPSGKPRLVSVIEARRQSLTPSGSNVLSDKKSHEMGPPTVLKPEERSQGLVKGLEPGNSIHPSREDNPSANACISSKRHCSASSAVLGSPLSKRLRRDSNESSSSSGSGSSSEEHTNETVPSADCPNKVFSRPSPPLQRNFFFKQLLHDLAKKGYGSMTSHERESLLISTLSTQVRHFSAELEQAEQRARVMSHRALVYMGQRDEALGRLAQTQEVLLAERRYAGNTLHGQPSTSSSPPRAKYAVSSRAARPEYGPHYYGQSQGERWAARSLSTPFLPGETWRPSSAALQSSPAGPSVPSPSVKMAADSTNPQSSVETFDNVKPVRRRTQSVQSKQQRQKASFRRERLASHHGFQTLKTVRLEPPVTEGPQSEMGRGAFGDDTLQWPCRVRMSSSNSSATETQTASSPSPSWASPSSNILAPLKGPSLPGLGAILSSAP